MTSAPLSARAGTAMLWQGLQLGGVKLIYLVRVVVLARLLAPEDFGLFAVALVSVDVLLSVTNFGLVPALVQRPDVRKEHFDAAWTIGLVRALAVAAGLIALAPVVAALFGEPSAAPLLRVLAVRPVLEALGSMRVAELRKELRFRSLAGLQLTEAVVNTAVSIALVAPLGVWALVAGPIAGAAVYAVLSYIVAPMWPRLRWSGVETGHLAVYGRWILVMAWAALAGRTLLQLGISRELGAAALGLYFMAGKLAFLPADVSNQVVGSVVFPVFAQVQADEERRKAVFRAALLGLGVLVIPVSLLIVSLAPRLAADLLGERWLPAVPLIQILALVNILGILGDVVVPLLNGTGRPSGSAAMASIQYAILVVAAVLLAPRFGLVGVVAAWLPATLVSQALGFRLARVVLDRPLRGLSVPLLAVLLAGVAGSLTSLAFVALVPGAAGTLVGGLIGGSAAMILVYMLDRRLGIGLAETVARLFPAAVPAARRWGLL